MTRHSQGTGGWWEKETLRESSPTRMSGDPEPPLHRNRGSNAVPNVPQTKVPESQPKNTK